jgi:hypothetical protein
MHEPGEEEQARAGRTRGAPPPGRRELVDTPAALRTLASELATARAIGVDLETAFQPRESRQRFALLQMAAERTAWAVDPVRLPDLRPLAPIFADPAIVKVFCAAGGDAPFLEAAGLPLRALCDVAEVGRSAFGRRGEGLQALVERAFGVVMDKSLQRSDWLKRPLTSPLLAYAYRDAELTLALYQWFVDTEPALVAMHSTLLARPELPPGLPEWLRAILEGRRNGDRRVAADDLVEAAGLDVQRDVALLLAGCEEALRTVRDVRPRARLLDAIGELDLFELAPALLDELRSPSATLRFSAARALGRLADEEATAPLRALQAGDPVEDVREVAGRALRAIRDQAERDRQGREAGETPPSGDST